MDVDPNRLQSSAVTSIAQSLQSRLKGSVHPLTIPTDIHIYHQV